MVSNKYYNFLIGCIGLRIAIAIIAKKINKKYLPYMAYIALIPALGFLSIYLGDLRNSGFEAEGAIWWNKLRPIHAIMYILFALYAYKGESWAWIVLLMDALLGLLFWFMRYYLKINFS